MGKTASITKAQIVRAVATAREIDPFQVVEIELPSGAILRFPEIQTSANAQKTNDEEVEDWQKAFD
ncbi:hypothetical protein J7443_12225 [Tropicibacter sp. R15_0]|uniref:hypothetical protein n=1 Tax=Tropicibacter sp. R15_0 TaxID=2821101 RepID=UPI001ADC74CF|nr:hypothetical protein [Tropicibacter sp. R15_0]MBO9466002.1 hypothetical protein [Tropicibacter sp. R15_0]